MLQQRLAEMCYQVSPKAINSSLVVVEAAEELEQEERPGLLKALFVRRGGVSDV